MLAYEVMYITTYDGIKYPLTDGQSRFVLTTPGNMGLPSIEYLTERTYKQDGSTEIGYRLNNRDFTVMFRNQGCSRADYWRLRTALINALRPNRGGQATFTIRLSTGELRSIVIRSISPVFPEVDVTRWDEFSYTEVLQFTAFDPVWFDPNEQQYTVSNEPSGELSFPLAFDGDNIYFGNDGFGIADIPYLGNWYSYPVILITAPFTGVTIANLTTGATLVLTVGLESGYMVIDLASKVKTITDDQGNDLWGYLTLDSDINRFRLEPDPIAPSGVNQISFILPGYTTDTQVTIDYNNRYIGI